MPKYVALLRGINVGGKGIVKMSALKAAFEKLGYTDVATFIQSGNVLFSSAKKQQALAREITAMLSKKFGLDSKVVILSAADLETVVNKCPKGFGKKPDDYKYDIMFFVETVDSKKVLATLPLQEGVDAAYPGPNLLYFSRLRSQDSKSKLPKVISMPIYKSLTIRNWNTTVRLLALLEN